MPKEKNKDLSPLEDFQENLLPAALGCVSGGTLGAALGLARDDSLSLLARTPRPILWGTLGMAMGGMCGVGLFNSAAQLIRKTTKNEASCAEEKEFIMLSTLSGGILGMGLGVIEGHSSSPCVGRNLSLLRSMGKFGCAGAAITGATLAAFHGGASSLEKRYSAPKSKK